MGMKEKIIKSQLRRLGIDVSNPKNVTTKTIRDLINASIPSLFTSTEMIVFLKNEIERIKKENW